MKHSQSAFTLIELGIVLTIIALIAGGIIGAQSIVRASHLQAMLGEYDAYSKAVKEFQDKFLALPGDMNNAESMWGSDAGCPNTPTTTILHSATCNGDGGGTIGTSDTSGNLSNSTEWFRAWQQLSDAGLITGTFTGTIGSGGAMESRIGQNVPASSADGAGWTLFFYNQIADNANLWGDQYGHLMTLGAFKAANPTQSPAFTTAEAVSIDQKIDDGNPGLGIVRAYRSALQPGCTTDSGTQASQAYVSSTSSSRVCSLVFLMRF